MDLHEKGVYACCYRRPGQRRDKFTLSSGTAACPARQLDAVGRIIDNRAAERVHDLERAHVNNQVVIAQSGPAFGQKQVGVARFLDLFHRMLHVPG